MLHPVKFDFHGFLVAFRPDRFQKQIHRSPSINGPSERMWEDFRIYLFPPQWTRRLPGLDIPVQPEDTQKLPERCIGSKMFAHRITENVSSLKISGDFRDDTTVDLFARSVQNGFRFSLQYIDSPTKPQRTLGGDFLSRGPLLSLGGSLIGGHRWAPAWNNGLTGWSSWSDWRL